MVSFYVTTPIYYVNDRPHIGHLYTTVVADTLARYRRFRKDRVRFLTGTDEHGQNIEKVARREGISPIEVANRHAPVFSQLWQSIGVTNDDFIRTTEPRHKAGVDELIRRIAGNDDFYLAGHEGWYCASCEAYYPEKDLVEGACPVHGSKPEWQREENVFFRLSRYGDRLLELYEKGVNGRPFVYPESRLNEVKSFVQQGLKDLSVSRTAIKWGIPFPGYPGHVVYVWLDALTNYISALGFGQADSHLYQEFWQGDGDRLAVHLVGKDILRFHAVYWPAFLMSAGLPLPSQVVSHGWWLKDLKKMSKSTGNVVRPAELIETFGVDALRWHLLAEMVFGQDANFSDESFLNRYNADLANGIGNTVSRAVRMAFDAFGGNTPSESCNDNDVMRAAEVAVRDWTDGFENYRFHDAVDAIRRLLAAIDGYIASREPWKRIKTEGMTPALSRIHYNALEGLRLVAVMAAPIVPATAAAILKRLGIDGGVESLSRSDLAWGQLPLGSPIDKPSPLFPRADVKAYLSAPPLKEKTVQDEPKTVPPVVPAAEAAAPVQAAPAPVTAAVTETPRITIDDFAKLDLRVGEVLAAEKVEKSKKLMKMSIRVGEEVRTVVGGIATAYKPEDLVGRKVVIVANLAPAKLMGIESNGMVLAASLPGTGEPSLLAVDPAVPSGTRVK
jgi:methionyl-tRNA synthetase